MYTLHSLYRSVLVVAGGFKRQEPDLQEEALLMRALRDFNIPKIVRILLICILTYHIIYTPLHRIYA